MLASHAARIGSLVAKASCTIVPTKQVNSSTGPSSIAKRKSIWPIRRASGSSSLVCGGISNIGRARSVHASAAATASASFDAK